MATDSFFNSKIVQVEDGDGDEGGSYPSLSQGSDMGDDGNNRKQAGGGGEGEGEVEEDVYTQSEGVRKLRKCPEAVDAFKVLWTVSKSAAQHDMGKYCTDRTVLRLISVFFYAIFFCYFSYPSLNVFPFSLFS